MCDLDVLPCKIWSDVFTTVLVQLPVGKTITTISWYLKKNIYIKIEKNKIKKMEKDKTKSKKKNKIQNPKKKDKK